MLNSAAGVTLPSSKQAPPITTNSPSLPANSGALTSAIAILVSGPNAHTVIVPGSAERNVSIRKSTPCCACSGIAGSGNTASRRGSLWMRSAVTSGRISGRAQPANMGTSGRSAKVQTRRAFRSVCGKGRLPATATMPRTSSSSIAANASSSATASSKPGSVSIMIRRRMSAVYRRSTSSFLISAIAFAGLRFFGQVRVQFMIV